MRKCCLDQSRGEKGLAGISLIELSVHFVWKPASQSFSSASHVCWTRPKFCLSPASAPASVYFNKASGQMKKYIYQFHHNSRWKILTSDKCIKIMIILFYFVIFSVMFHCHQFSSHCKICKAWLAWLTQLIKKSAAACPQSAICQELHGDAAKH